MKAVTNTQKTWSGRKQVHACCFSLCVLIGALLNCLNCLTEGLILLTSSISSDSYAPFTFSLWGSLSFGGKDSRGTSHTELSVPRSVSLHDVWLWISASLLMSESMSIAKCH